MDTGTEGELQLPLARRVPGGSLGVQSAHEVSDMCHLFQKPATVVARYGLLKFSIRLMPSSLALPIAMSEYPLKSQ